MADLFSDDLEDQHYTDAMVLRDLRALISTGLREGSLIDYKSDVSERDTWPASVAAFANSFGGLIIFGVESENDLPKRVAGFDPGNVEIKTKLTSMVIDRIQPRPDFSVRVVTFDEDPEKVVALLRVMEGRNPPYMHSKNGQHRILIRVEAQKVDADYLQLSSLLEKRKKTEGQGVPSINEMFGANSFLHVPKPPEARVSHETEEDYRLRVLRGSNLVSAEQFRFVLSPRNIGSAIRLNFETERQFSRCVNDVLETPNEKSVIRSKHASIFPVANQGYGEQRFGLAAKGGIGFVSFPGITTNNSGVLFVPVHFCRYLVDFLCIASLFYEKAMRFYGSAVLDVSMNTGVVNIIEGFPVGTDQLKGSNLFYPPLTSINVNGSASIEWATHPISPDRLQDCLEAVLLDLIRPSGSVLNSKFRGVMQPLVERSVEQFHSVRL